MSFFIYILKIVEICYDLIFIDFREKSYGFGRKIDKK